MTTGTETTATKPDYSKTNRALLIWGLVAAALIAAVVVFVQVRAAQADAERVDGYYCALEGVGPFDRAPETGKLCAELGG